MALKPAWLDLSPACLALRFFGLPGLLLGPWRGATDEQTDKWKISFLLGPLPKKGLFRALVGLGLRWFNLGLKLVKLELKWVNLRLMWVNLGLKQVNLNWHGPIWGKICQYRAEMGQLGTKMGQHGIEICQPRSRTWI